MYYEVISCSSKLHSKQSNPGVLNFRFLQVRVDIKAHTSLRPHSPHSLPSGYTSPIFLSFFSHLDINHCNVNIHS